MNLSQHLPFGGKKDAYDERDLPFAPVVHPAELPSAVNLQGHCGEVYNQLPLQSCSAHAISSMLTYVANKDGEPIPPPSRLFLYYNERALEGTQATDCGATLRNGMKSVAKQGVCHEDIWPYDTTKYAVQPPPECYAQAVTVRALRYSRIDQSMNDLKACLAEGYPFVFGMQVYYNIGQAQTTGHLAMPGPSDQFMAGHAVMAVGYDDATQTILALNSVGPTWGMKGYFTLPYAYLTDPKLSYDFWTIRQIGD